jgi:hypothetical protein
LVNIEGGRKCGRNVDRIGEEASIKTKTVRENQKNGKFYAWTGTKEASTVGRDISKVEVASAWTKTRITTFRTAKNS